MTLMRRIPRLAWRYAVLEVRLYAALLRWLLRRRDIPAGAEPWGYAQLVTPVMWLWVFGSATELVVLHLIIPWEGVRLVVDIISAWGLIWMLGTLAAYRIRPHLLLGEQLRIRSGVYHELTVPLSAIATATAREADLPSSVFSLQIQDDELSLGVSGRTNVILTLKAPTPITTAKGVLHATTVRLWADQPRELVARLEKEIVSRSQQTAASAAARTPAGPAGAAPPRPGSPG